MSSLPILQWVPGYDVARDLRSDLMAGVTLGAVVVPQAMALALLAGLPIEVGLYTATVPPVLYVLFGTSRQLSVGPAAIVSLLTASALGPIVVGGSEGYLRAAALLALMVGVVHILLGVGRLGFVVNLLSHPVLVGFSAAASLIIGFSQVKYVLGVSVERQDHFYLTVKVLIQSLGQTDATTLAVGLGSIAGLLLVARFARKLPSALIVVTVAALVSQVLDLRAHGLSVVGDIPASLPGPSIPDSGWALVRSLIPSAVVITLVGFVQSIAVTKIFARRHNYEIDPNRELVALGLSNLGAGLFAGAPVSGGFSRTAVNDRAGARSPLASLVTAGIVVATIVFFTPLFRPLPFATLGAIIIVAVAGLVDTAEMRRIATIKRSDAIGMGVAFFATLILGIEMGILVAVLASLAVVAVRLVQTGEDPVGRGEGVNSFRGRDRFPEASLVDGVRVVRIDASLSFVNSVKARKVLVEAASVRGPNGGTRALVLDASGIDDLDTTGAEMLRELMGQFDQTGVDFRLAAVKDPVRDVMRRAGLLDDFGSSLRPSIRDALAAISVNGPTPYDRSAAGADKDGGSD